MYGLDMRTARRMAIVITVAFASCQAAEPLPDREAEECEDHADCLVFPEGKTPFCDGSCVAIEEIGRCCGCLDDDGCLPDVDANECSSAIEGGGSVDVVTACANGCSVVCDGVLAPVR